MQKAWELRSYPNKQKGEQTEKGRTQGKPLPQRLERQTGEYRKLWLTEAEAHEWKLPQEPEGGKENWWTAGGLLWIQSWGAPQYYKIYL